ncbi:hypothetical protein ACFX2I_032798 [Malus domestica]
MDERERRRLPLGMFQISGRSSFLRRRESSLMEMRREEVGRVLPPSWTRDLEEKQSLDNFSDFELTDVFCSRDLNFTGFGPFEVAKVGILSPIQSKS